MKRSTPSEITATTTCVTGAGYRAFGHTAKAVSSWRSRTFAVLLLMVSLLTASRVDAQVSRYQFSQSVGTYTPITGGVVLGTATGAGIGAPSLDDNNYAIAAGTIPFTFTYNGTGYTGCFVNTNGFISMSAATTTNNYIPISASDNNTIAATGLDMNSLFNVSGNTGELRYQTVGTTPNREFVIQYKNFRPYSTSTSATAYFRWNFQIRLKEDNSISIVYDLNATGTPTTSSGVAQVGIRGAAATDYSNRINTLAWDKSNLGTANTSNIAWSTTLLPVSGLTYTWTPAACAVPTTILVPAGSITITSATINWTASASTPTGGYNWKVVAQNSGSEATGLFSGSVGAGVVTASATGLNPNTTYAAYVRSNCGTTNSSWNGPTNFTTPIACAAITSSAATAIATTGATANWSGGTGTYVIEYGPTGFTPGTGATAGSAGSSVVTSGAGTTSIALVGLNPSTSYQYYVRQLCPNLYYSTNTTVQSFNTLCAAVAPPYTEGFEGLTTAGTMPICMSASPTISTSGKARTYIAAATGTNAALTARTGNSFAAANWSPVGSAYFYSVPLTLTAGTSYDASIYYRTDATQWDSATIMYGSSQTGTAANMIVIANVTPALSNGAYTLLKGTFTPATTGTYYVAFRGQNITTAPNYISFDDFSVVLTPSCVIPSSSAATAITASSATANWTGGTGSYIIEYGATGFTPGTGVTAGTGGTVITASAGATSATIPGLTGNTAYQYYVRQVCSGPSYSANSAVQSFTTSCTAVAPPYLEGFEGLTVANTLPTCMSAAPAVGAASKSRTFIAAATGTNAALTANTGSKFASVNWSPSLASSYFYSAPLTLTAGTSYDASVYWRTDGVQWDSVTILYGTSSTGTSATMKFIANTTPALSSGAYTLLKGTFIPAATGTYYVAFRGYNATSSPNYVSFDDFSVVVTPTCVAPTATAATAITSTGATANWTSGAGTITSYVVEYGPTGFTPGTGATAGSASSSVITVAAPASSAALTALSSNTVYQYYVRQLCSGPTSYSANSAVQAFTTLCGSTGIPYTQDFESVTVPAIPACNSVQNIGSGKAWVTTSNPGFGFTSTTLIHPWDVNYAANTWYYTQGLNMTAGVIYRLTYRYGCTSGAAFPEKMEVKYGTSAIVAGMTTTLATHNPIINQTPLTNSVDFVAPSTGVFYIGFHAFSNADEDALLLDDISVTIPPVCSGAPTAGTATISTSGTQCVGNATTVTVAGYSTTGGVILQWQSKPAGSGTFTDIAGAISATYTETPSASTDYRCKVTCTPSSTSSFTNTVTQLINSPSVTTSGTSICGAKTVTLTATPGSASDTVYWYPSATATTSLAKGNTFTTPVLSATTTYYVGAITGQAPVYGGKLSTTGVDGTDAGLGGLVFNATSSFTLAAVDMYPDAGGLVTIEVQNSSGVTVPGLTTTYAFTAGTTSSAPVTVPLNFLIPAGTGYHLVVTANDYAIGFIYDYTVAAFPYAIGSVGSVTGGWYVGSSDPEYNYFYNLKIGNGCQGPRTPVTVTYTAPPALTVNPSSSSICNGDSVTLTATGSAYSVFAWTPTGTIAPTTGTTVKAKPTTTVDYTVSGSGASGGCTNTAIAHVDVKPTPAKPVLSPTTALICQGTVQALSATVTNAANQYAFGTQAAQNTAGSFTSTDYPAPYTGFYGGQKMQILIRASELTAAGFGAGSNLTDIQFPVVSLGSNWGSTITSCKSFRVSIGNTAATVMTTTFATGLTTVVAAANYTPTVGYNNTHTFATPFTWNGTSNIILETTYSNNVTGTANSTVTQYNSPVSYVSTAVYRVDGTGVNAVANATTATYTYSARPDFKLNGTTIPVLSWTPTTDLYTDAAATTTYTGGASATVYAKPSVSTTYYAVATTPNACSASDSARITVSAASTPPTSATATPASICSGDNAVLTYTGGSIGTGGTAKWYTASCGGTLVGTGNSLSVTPTATTVYYVRFEDPAPCSTLTTCQSVTVTVGTASTAPTGATATPAAICLGSSSVLTYTGGTIGTGGTAKWYSASCGGTLVGTGNSLSVTPTATTTYYVRYEDPSPCGTLTACQAVTVTVNSPVTAHANTVNAATISNTMTYTLSGSATNYSSFSWSVSGVGTLSNTSTLTPTFTPTGSLFGTVRIVLTVNSLSPCAGPVRDTMILTVTPAAGNSWIGNTSDWYTASNWSSNVVPVLCTDIANIPALSGGFVYPVLNGSSPQVGNLNISAGAQITINAGKTLSICGNWTGGTASAATILGPGAVILNGTGAQTVGGKTIFPTLIVNKAAGTTTNTGATDINTALVLTKGNVTNSGTVTLKSNGSGTAYLDNFTSTTAGTYTGDVTVERYIGGTTVGYRELSPPVAATVSDWAADFSVIGQDGVNCYYAYNPYPSLQYYNEAINNISASYYGGFISVTAPTRALGSGRGYAARIYSAPLTINTTGAPGTGAKVISLTKTTSSDPTADGWNLIGNPYPSPISWNSVKALNAGKTDGSVYRFMTSGEYSGNYATWNGTVGTNGATDQIASTQGFWVLATTSSAFNMANSVRVASTSAPFFKTTAAQPDEIRLVLGNGVNTDEIVSYTDPNTTIGYEPGYDAAKIVGGSTVYLSFDMPAKESAINVMDQITEQTVLPLRMAVTDSGVYTLTATELNLTDLTAYLKDAETNTMYDLTTTVPTLTLRGSQYYTGRYSVVFKKKTTTPTGIVNTTDNKTRIYSYGNKVYIQRSNADEATIDVTNILGQDITQIRSNTEKTEFELPATEPWYAIVRVNEKGRVTVNKVLISTK